MLCKLLCEGESVERYVERYFQRYREIYVERSVERRRYVERSSNSEYVKATNANGQDASFGAWSLETLKLILPKASALGETNSEYVKAANFN